MYVYIQSEQGLYTVGFYSPDGKWYAESDHDDPQKAAERTHYLNGGKSMDKQITNARDTESKLPLI